LVLFRQGLLNSSFQLLGGSCKKMTLSVQNDDFATKFYSKSQHEIKMDPIYFLNTLYRILPFFGACTLKMLGCFNKMDKTKRWVKNVLIKTGLVHI